MPSMSPTLISNVSSGGTATTAALPDNTYTGITLEPDTMIVTPTQFLSTIQAITSFMIIETTSTSTTHASPTSQTTRSSSTLDTSQAVRVSTSTSTSSSSTLGTSQTIDASSSRWTNVSSNSRYLTSTTIWSTIGAIQTYTSISASSTSNQPLSVPSSALPESDPSDNIYPPMMIVSIVVAGGFISVLFMIIMWLLWKRIIWRRRSIALHGNSGDWKP